MNKNIVVCVILSIVTCGIYSLYWLYTLNEAARTVNPNEWQMGGGMVILLSIITCGIFGLYWYYKMGKALWPSARRTTAFCIWCFPSSGWAS